MTRKNFQLDTLGLWLCNVNTKCTFYPEIRKKAKAAALFHEIYRFLKPHFSGDDQELMDYIAQAIESYKEV